MNLKRGDIINEFQSYITYVIRENKRKGSYTSTTYTSITYCIEDDEDIEAQKPWRENTDIIMYSENTTIYSAIFREKQ